ncbi:PAS domain-containing protein, partial [Mycobacterium tuberculosis]
MIQLRDVNQSLESEAAARAVALQRMSDVQRAILGNAGYAIVVTDASGRITVFNAAAEAMLGYRAEDVLGQGLDRFH